MKLLIGGKNRNIYMRKDGSAYYKSGSENVDVSYMFKKNGGGLKKQYIGGVQDNLGKVEQKKRSKKGVKQILGGAISNITFDKIEINSEDIIKNGNYQSDTAAEQLKKICCLALYGLGAAITGELAHIDAKDQIKVLVGLNLQGFVNYLNKAIQDGPAKDKIKEILDAVDKNTTFKENVVDVGLAEGIKNLGFNNVTANTDFSGEDKYVTVTRAYILNKILQCFEGNDANCIAHWNENLPDLAPPDSIHLKDKTMFIDPISGELAGGIDKLKEVSERICIISKESDEGNIEKSATNLHTVLFMEEQIGAPS